jgi:O-methyltransferase
MGMGVRAARRGLLARFARMARGRTSSGRNGTTPDTTSGCRPRDEVDSIDTLLADDPARWQAMHDLLRTMPDQALGLLEMLGRGMRAETTESERYQIAEALTTSVYPKYKFSEFARLFLDDERFLEYYRRFMDPDNWHSLDRKYTLDQLLRLTFEIDGDTAECGVYKGASSYLICRAIRPYAKRNHLFDSFQGLSAPTTVDGTYWQAGALRAGEQQVRENLREFENFVIHPGWIPQRFGDVADKRFSFVHIDVDLYEPTRDSVVFFYDRLSPGAVMLFDDYGFATCPGAKLAVDEFFRTRPERTVMLSTGQAFVVKGGEERSSQYLHRPEE